MAIAESELRWGRLQNWTRDLKPLIAQAKINPEQFPQCHVSFVTPQYEILVRLGREWEIDIHGVINLLINEQRVVYEDGTFQTREEFVVRLQSVIDRQPKVIRRMESAGIGGIFKNYCVYALPENKNFLIGLIEQVDLSRIDIRNISTQGAVLTGLLPQPKMPPLHVAGLPVSEEFANLHERLR